MKSVLITGCSSGFGYLSALKFARNGYHVYATSRNLDKDGIRKLIEISKSEGLSMDVLALDVIDQSSIEVVLKKVESLDVLINNAGYGALGCVDSFSEEDVRKQMETNYFGVFKMIKAFLPLLKKSKGKIINLSSLAGIVAATGYGIYSSSKFAVEALSSSLRAEMKQYGVSVSLINPGGFDTQFGANADVSDREGSNGKMYEATMRLITKLKLRDPNRVVELMYRVAKKRNPHFHNIIGVDATIIMFLKKILPDSWYMAMMGSMSNS